MEIRPATLQDVPGILPLVAKICALHKAWDPAKYGFLDHPEKRYEWWLNNRVISDARSVVLVAAEKEKIIAFLIGTVEQEIPIYQIKEFGFVHDVWVEEEYRNEGIARQLATLAIEKFREIGVKQIRLDTAGPNDVARNLFRACGFRVSAIEMLLELE
jgi:ribosomal protein S18 acetylase RimI-like enzyme